MTQTCANCKFLKSGNSPGCRRYPPYAQALIVPRPPTVATMGPPQLIPVEESRAMFPSVRPDWWCGEWAPRIEAMS